MTVFRDDETLLIGLGGHKCGSTWLHDYFSGHIQCFAPLQKELDYFSAPLMPNLNWMMRDRLHKAMKALGNFHTQFGKIGFEQMAPKIQARFLRIQDLVFDLTASVGALTGHGEYHQIFSRRKKWQSVNVDISPSYSLATVEILKNISQYHNNTKFLFIMRDPAERLYSAFRYRAQLQKTEFPTDLAARMEMISAFIDDPYGRPYTEYGQLIRNIEAAGLRDRCYMGFYENLFCDQSMTEICEFLGIEFMSGNYDRFVHRTQIDNNSNEMTKDEKAFLVNSFFDVYNDIYRYFGENSPQSWNWPQDLQKPTVRGLR